MRPDRVPLEGPHSRRRDFMRAEIDGLRPDQIVVLHPPDTLANGARVALPPE